jgi:CHASE2 domain-containing sensor protein
MAKSFRPFPLRKEFVDARQLRPMARRERFFRVGLILLAVFLICLVAQLRFSAATGLDYVEQFADKQRRAIYVRRNSISIAEVKRQIVLVTISEETFEDLELSGPPIPRDYHAQVVRELLKAGAKVIAFDLIFDAPRSGDDQLAKAAAGAPEKILWAAADLSDTESGSQGALSKPTSKLRRAAPNFAHIHFFQDLEHPTVDRLQAVMLDGQSKVPAFSLQAVLMAKGLGREVLKHEANSWEAGRFSVPVDGNDTFSIAFLGQRDQTFPSFPYELVYNGGANAAFGRDNQFFRDKIVLIGDTTKLGKDVFYTKLGTMPGLEIHAQAIATLLQRRFVREASLLENGVVLAVLMGLTCFFVAAWRWKAAMGAVLALGLIYAGLNIWLFVDHGVALNLVAPWVSIGLLTLALLTERGLREERESKRVGDVLEQYVSPQLAKDGAPVGVVTLVFTDLEGSSALSERLGARFEGIRNEHFRILREVGKKWNGFEVETAGDSIFLVFSRAADAVQFAVEAQIALENHPWPTEAGTVRVRIGMHTGEPFVAQDRVRLTYRGPVTNRAARVMGAAQGGQILVSPATLESVGNMLPTSLSFSDAGLFDLKGIGQETLWEVCQKNEPTENGFSG